jgi:hypothetical protein
MKKKIPPLSDSKKFGIGSQMLLDNKRLMVGRNFVAATRNCEIVSSQ